MFHKVEAPVRECLGVDLFNVYYTPASTDPALRLGLSCDARSRLALPVVNSGDEGEIGATTAATVPLRPTRFCENPGGTEVSFE